MVSLYNVLLYLRKSRKDIEQEKKAAENGQEYDTLERHRQQLLKLAKEREYDIVDVLEEIVSGEYILDRPVMQDLLKRVEMNTVDGVLVMDLDRLGRGDMSDQGIIDRVFRFTSTKIITPSEDYDPTSENWELTFGIKSLVAREELKSITKRLLRGRRQSANEGKHIGYKPPYGYTRGDDLKLVPNPETAWVVKKIFDLANNGFGRKRICIELNKLGIPSPTGKSWGEATIRQMQNNEVYIGTIIWGTKKSTKINGKYVQRKLPRDQWVIIENAHEPIIEPDLFYKVQDAVHNRLNTSVPQKNDLKNPLAGILKCELCGLTMKYTKPPNRDRGYIHCRNPQCEQRTASFYIVEEKVLEGLEQTIEDFKIKKDMFEKENKKDNTSANVIEKAIQNKQKELDELNNQKNNLHDLLERGVYDIDTFISRQKNISERIEAVTDAMNTLTKELEKESEQKDTFDKLLPAIESAIMAYRNTNDVHKKNRLLKSVLEKATFNRDHTHSKKDEFIIKLYPKAIKA